MKEGPRPSVLLLAGPVAGMCLCFLFLEVLLLVSAEAAENTPLVYLSAECDTRCARKREKSVCVR